MSLSLRFSLKEILLVLVLVVISFFAQGQLTYKSVVTATNITPAIAPQPAHRYTRVVYYISAAQMASGGIVSGKELKGIQFNYNSISNTSVTGNLTFWLQNTADVSYNKGIDWATAITGMTKVSTGTETIPTASLASYAFHDGDANFVYNGGGVYVAFEWLNLSGALGSQTNALVNNTPAATLSANVFSYTDTTPLGTLTARTYIPVTSFGVDASFDAAITNVYGLSNVPSNEAKQRIFANVRNVGPGAAITSVNATLTVTGANTFTATKNFTFATPLAVGESTIITFDDFVNQNEGTNTIRVTLNDSDDNSANNSYGAVQNVINGAFSYNIGTQNVGTISSSASNMYLSKYTANGPSVYPKAARFLLSADANIVGKQVKAVWYNSDKVKLGESLPYTVTSSDLGSTVNLPFIAANVAVPSIANSTDFYVGVGVLDPAVLPIAFMGYQNENPLRPETFYEGDIGTGVFSASTYKPMIEVLTGQSQAALNAGIYPINGIDNAPSSFASLRSAVNYITVNGVAGTGQVIFEFANGYDPTLVDFPTSNATAMALPSIPGTSANLGITIRPAANYTGTLALSANLAAALIEFNGAKYITIDGRKGGLGTNIGLTLENTASSSGTTLVFYNGASYNKIQYTNLLCNSSAVVNFAGTSGVGSGNSHNTISNNYIGSITAAVTYGIYSSGTVATKNIANVITDNNIAKFTNCGVMLSGTNGSGNEWVITGNSIFDLVKTTATSYAIFIGDETSSGHTITNNYIGGTQPQCGGSKMQVGRYYGITLHVGKDMTTLIQNNTIANIECIFEPTSLTASNSFFNLMYLGGGDVNVLNNTFGSQTETGSIIVENTRVENYNLYANAIYARSYTGNGALIIRSNNFGGLTFKTGGGISSFLGTLINTEENTYANLIIEDNILGGTVAGSIQNSGDRPILLGSIVSAYAGSINRNIFRNFSVGNASSTQLKYIFINDSRPTSIVRTHGNKIIHNNSSPSLTYLYGIQLAGAQVIASNNLILMRGVSANTNIYALIVNDYNTAVSPELYHNTVHTDGGANSAGIYCISNNEKKVYNNIVSQINAGAYYHNLMLGTGSNNINNNLYVGDVAVPFTTETNSITFRYGTEGYPASVDDFFGDIASGDLRVNNPHKSIIAGKGTPIAAVTKDIDGVTRASIPTIGAYEEDITVLPVTVNAFTASLKYNKVPLKWNVGVENNVEYYQIDRSVNGKDYTEITKVMAGGLNGYETVDSNPFFGVNYYRLKIVDKDGSYIYYNEIKAVNVAQLNKATVSVYPNPVIGNSINVSLMNYSLGVYNYKLISLDGRLIQGGNLNNSSGKSTIELSNKITKGGYLLQIFAGDDILQTKLVKN